MTTRPSPAFWHGKRVLITGHTGFKGAWMSIWLNKLGVDVAGISLEPSTEPSLFDLAGVQRFTSTYFQDIRDEQALSAIIKDWKPEILFHLAAQPLVLASYDDPIGTFSTNVQGTANLLNAVRGIGSARLVVSITTDKVYQNFDEGFPFRESDSLGGHDPYSASKAAAEIVIASFRDAFLADQGVAVASARAGNVIGGGDWSPDRLIPDAVRAWGGNEVLQVRRPYAVRPWQHVLEPLAGYLRLAEVLWNDASLAGPFNFGPNTHEAATVGNVLAQAREAFGGGEMQWDTTSKGAHEARWLSLEISKARQKLGFEPYWSLQKSIVRTMNWYREQSQGKSALDLCMSDIKDFEACMATTQRSSQ